MPTDPHTEDARWEYVAALAGGLAHEIKNPLGTITLNLQLLQEEWAEPKTAKDRRILRKLEGLQGEVQRLRQTLDDFLRVVRADPPQLLPTDVNNLAAEIAEFIEPELARENIEFLEQYSERLPRCMADPKLLKQAVLNLILNAQQATPDGGQIILRTSSADGFVHIEIIDTGSGIPERLLGKVFDPFFSTKQGGTGLGLAMTRRIIDQHGGSIDFHSQPGTGTDFALRLPACPDDTEENAS